MQGKFWLKKYKFKCSYLENEPLAKAILHYNNGRKTSDLAWKQSILRSATQSRRNFIKKVYKLEHKEMA